jgi:hypothetical protein
LAALNVKDFKDSSTLSLPGCMEVTDNGDVWEMCADDQATADAWFCPLKTVLGQSCEEPPVGDEKIEKVL